MQLQDALRDAPAYVRNAQDVAQKSPPNPDVLYMWDNQVTAIESFLASTEDFNGQSPDLARIRKELFGLKKQIESKVLEFELKQENQDMPPEPTEQELIADFTEYGKDIMDLVKELDKQNPRSLKDLQELEDPRQQLDNFLVETEPLQGKDPALDKIRQAAKKCRADLEAKAATALKAARAQEASEPDEEED